MENSLDFNSSLKDAIEKKGAWLNTEALPKGQRSVLLKNFVANIIDTIRVPKTNIFSVDLGTLDHNAIIHFKKNRNNHTTSSWNCIGIRVIPEI